MNADEQARADMQEGFDQATYGVTNKQLDALTEKDVRYDLSKGKYGAPGSTSHEIVLSWLAFKDTERAEASLAISKKALSNSQLATRIAIIAIVLSAIMAIQKLIEWSSK